MTEKKTKKKPSTWETLSAVDVSDHTEKKNGFTYLSWAWAWGVLMEHYPDATFTNHHSDSGYPCFFDPRGNAMVRVTLCISGVERTEDYPVLDYKNQAISDPDAFAVNTSLKRCLVKCMAYFGLGHYIYAGEDLPPGDDKAEAPDLTEAQQELNRLRASQPKSKGGLATNPQIEAIRAEFTKAGAAQRKGLRKDLVSFTGVRLPDGADPEKYKLDDIRDQLTERGAQSFLDRPPF